MYVYNCINVKILFLLGGFRLENLCGGGIVLDPTRSKGEMQWIGCIEVPSLIAGPIKQRETEYNIFC